MEKGKNKNGDLQAKRQKAIENLVKAREARKMKAQEKKQNPVKEDTDTDSDSDDSSSDEFSIVPVSNKKKGRKKITTKDDDMIERMMQLETAMKQLHSKSKKNKTKKTPVINNHITIPGSQKADEPKKDNKQISREDLLYQMFSQ